MPALEGLMQQWPLTTDRFLDHAARWHGNREVVSRREDGGLDRSSYRQVRDVAARISNALIAHGIADGDRVATLAMNGAAHLSAWYGISGIGAVCHTLNPRFAEEQLHFIVNHAEDRILFADGAFAPLVARIVAARPSLERVVFLSPPVAPVAGAILLDTFIAEHSTTCRWGGFDEQTAVGLCYTSGTTGDPKGVLYSHRSNFLHTLLTIQPDMFGVSTQDTILPVVPMYHANAWGICFSAPCVGAKLVLPGSRLDGASLAELIAGEGVTVAAGVPTVWLGLIEHLRTTGMRLPTLSRVIVGGAALPEAILQGFDDLGIRAIHAWGMTELSPAGSVSTPSARTATLPAKEQLPFRLKQGRAPCGIELRLVDENGDEQPHDGLAVGALRLRGPTVASGYFRNPNAILDADGFFDSGDLATIDGDGFMRIADRAKDIIKSGGEWISSLEIENVALDHPGVALAAVVAMPHPKWGERPLLYVELRPGFDVVPGELRALLARRLPKMALPDDIRAIDAMPLGSTGKIDKKQLRQLIAVPSSDSPS